MIQCCLLSYRCVIFVWILIFPRSLSGVPRLRFMRCRDLFGVFVLCLVSLCVWVSLVLSWYPLSFCFSGLVWVVTGSGWYLLFFRIVKTHGISLLTNVPSALSGSCRWLPLSCSFSAIPFRWCPDWYWGNSEPTFSDFWSSRCIGSIDSLSSRGLASGLLTDVPCSFSASSFLSLFDWAYFPCLWSSDFLPSPTIRISRSDLYARLRSFRVPWSFDTGISSGFAADFESPGWSLSKS